MASIGLLTLHLLIPGCTSLKEKRGRIKPFLARIQNQFKISAAEVDLHDRWQESIVGCAVISNQPDHNHRLLQEVVSDLERRFPDIQIIDNRIELL